MGSGLPSDAASGRTRGGRVRRILAWLTLGLFCAALTLQAWYFTQVLLLRDGKPATSQFMRVEANRLASLGRAERLQHRWVPYGAIADTLKRAVVVSEDVLFVEHRGVDWQAIQRAWITNRAREEIAFGGSTITMQLAKNLYLSGQRSYWRKAQEVLIAWMLEALLGKQRILELYLNLAQWGDGLFGAQAAARHYFGIDAAMLNQQQAARLAAMLPRPAWYDQNRQSKALAARAAAIADIASVARIP